MVVWKSRTFYIDGKEMRFNNSIFKKMFMLKKDENDMRVTQYEEYLAEKLALSREAIHNWRNDINGPSTVEVVQELAKEWNCNYLKLMQEIKTVKEGECMENEYMIVRAAVKRVFVSMVEFMTYFEETQGFKVGLNGESEEHLKIAAKIKYKEVVNVIKQERIDMSRKLNSELMIFAEDRLNYLMEGYYEPEEGDTLENWKLAILEKVEEFYDDLKVLLSDYWID